MGPALGIVAMVALTVGYVITWRTYGYWKARTIGFVVLPVVFACYVLVLALGQIL